MTDINIEEIANEVAHRTCTKYVHDGELRYQFNDRHVVDFATRIIAAVDKARAEQNPVAWLYDWDSDEGQVKNWFAHDYQEVVDQDGYNVRPLYLCRQAPSVPNGWQLVPKVCTYDMAIAAWGDVINWEDFLPEYARAVAAAPTYKENEECSVAPLADGKSVDKVDFYQWFKDKGD